MLNSYAQVIGLLAALLLTPQTPGEKANDKLLDRAYTKAHQAWLTKDYRKGIAWLKPLRSRLARKPGAEALLGGLHHALGWQELKARNYRQAKRQFEQAAGVRPEEKNAWYSLGLACEALQDGVGAERNFSKTLAIDPKHFGALTALAKHEFAERRYAKARHYLDRAEKIHPGDPGLILLRERCSQDQALHTDFQSFSSPHFWIRFGGDIPKSNRDSKKILTHLETCHGELKKILGRAPDKRIEVILYSKKEFGSLRGVKDWMGAFYDGKVRIPLKSWRTHRGKVQELMRHELAHVFVETILPGASSWLHEGFAQWYQGRSSRGKTGYFRKSAPRTASDLRSPFAKIEDPAKASILYLQSLILVEELLSEGGTLAIRRLLNATAKAKGDYAGREDLALDRIQGSKLDDWIQELAKKRSWASPNR
jgi:tetratricopeptide (TPR) repeat protein